MSEFKIVDFNYFISISFMFEGLRIRVNVISLSHCHMTMSLSLSQTSFSLYLYNQWTDFYKLSYARKPQMRAIHTYAGYTKMITND